jgi:hypothetical protein
MRGHRSKWKRGGAIGAMSIASVAAVMTISLTGASAASRPVPPPTGKDGIVYNYSNQFSSNTKGWCKETQGCNGGTANTDSGTISVANSSFNNYGGYASTIAAPTGQASSAFARVSGTSDDFAGCTSAAGPGSEACTGPYTIYGGAKKSPETIFPKYGFSSSIELYLDASWANANPGQILDWDVALNASSGTNFGYYLQDYMFNLCTTGANGGGFDISTSNNAGGCTAGPFEESTSGWYKFEHDFYWSTTANALEVAYTIVNSTGQTVFQDTEPITTNIYTSGPLTKSQLGGPDYGWFPDEDVLGLPAAQNTLTINTASTPVPPTTSTP